MGFATASRCTRTAAHTGASLIPTSPRRRELCHVAKTTSLLDSFPSMSVDGKVSVRPMSTNDSTWAIRNLGTSTPAPDLCSTISYHIAKLLLPAPRTTSNNGEIQDSENSPLPRAAECMLKAALKFTTVFTLALFVLDKKRVLNKPMQTIMSRLIFWPTLPEAMSERLGNWLTPIDDVVILGGAPLGFAEIPERLHRDFGVRGVVNMCDEYPGPTHQYDTLGIEQLWLRTVNHFEPTVEDLKEAVSFLKEHERSGTRVYVHCRAGNGRSPAVVLAWLLYKYPNADPKQLNQHMCRLRKVRKQLWKQKNIVEFHSWLQGGHAGGFRSLHGNSNYKFAGNYGR